MSVVRSNSDAAAVEPWGGAVPTHAAVMWFCRAGLAITWFYNGLWLKLLDGRGRHAAVVAEASGWAPEAAIAMTVAIGVLECGLALLVIGGWRPWVVCVVQIAGLVCMNLAGFLGAGSLIEDAAGLVIHNFAFVSLIVAAAYLGNRQHDIVR